MSLMTVDSILEAADTLHQLGTAAGSLKDAPKEAAEMHAVLALAGVYLTEIVHNLVSGLGVEDSVLGAAVGSMPRPAGAVAAIKAMRVIAKRPQGGAK